MTFHVPVALQSRSKLFAAATISGLVLIFVALLLATPILNIDDLGYGEHMPLAVERRQFWYAFTLFLFNLDLGINQVRTYGLSRVIELITVAPTGISPLPIYAFLTFMHGVGAWVVFRFMRLVSADTIVAAFAAVAWFTAPSVLPLLKVEHHFLYLVAPFTPLLFWLTLNSPTLALRDKPISHVTGITLLTITWWLGESALLAMAAAVVWVVIANRDKRALIHAGVAATLLALYVGNQILFIRDSTLPQRVSFGTPTLEALNIARMQIGESGRAILGLRHIDGDVGRVGGIDVLQSPVTLLVFAVAFIAAMVIVRAPIESNTPAARWRWGAYVLTLITFLSVGVYVLFTVFQSGAMTTRYTAAFYAFIPLAVIALTAVYAPVHWARAVAGGWAALCLALGIGSLYRAEVLVNQPNRALLAAQIPGTGIVLRHNGWDATHDGVVNVSYPGFVSSITNGLQNPIRSAVLTEQALRLYSGVHVGTACMFTPDGTVALYFLGKKVADLPRDKVSAFGLSDRDDIHAKPRALEDVCKADAGQAPPN